MNFSRVVVIVTVTAAIVYAALTFLLPRNGKGHGAEPVATEAAAASEAPAAAESGAEAASAEPAAPAEDSTAAAAPTEDPALTEDEARRIAANVASEVASRVAAEGAAPAAEAAPSEPEPASEPEEVAEPAVEAPAPAPAKIASAPKAAAKPAASAAPAAASTKAPSGKLGNGQDVISAWWQRAPSSDHLNLVYVGEASTEKAVVLLFDNAVDAAAAGSQIKLIDAKGASPAGSWTNGSNPRLIAFKGIAAGRYTVIVSPGLADTGGKTVGAELVGPVYVR
ncbi:MAG: hypothetical protein NTW01_13380 [Gammaproteobacteria bacterium]|nr:hypothetical protein [Gammaproteobacteria bacterium]